MKIPFLTLQVGSRVGSPFTIINKRFYIYTQVIDFIWSGRPGSNRRRPAWEADILPLNYARSRPGTFIQQALFVKEFLRAASQAAIGFAVLSVSYRLTVPGLFVKRQHLVGKIGRAHV